MANPKQVIEGQRSRDYYRSIFLEADVDRSGYLSFTEFAAALRRKGYRGTPENLLCYFKQVDTTDDNKVSLPEFLKAMELLPRNDHLEALLKYNFNQFDENRDGKIDRNELDQVFLALGKVLSTEELDRIMKAIDKEGKGALNYDEFIAVISPKKMNTNTT